MLKAISVLYLFLSLIFFSSEALSALEFSGIVIVTIFLNIPLKDFINSFGILFFCIPQIP